MNEDGLKEIYRSLQRSQEKYVYFLLSATIASIGFTITQTQDLEGLDYCQLPLGLSLLFWGLSFWFGCRNRSSFNSALFANYELLKVQMDKHPLTKGRDSVFVKATLKEIMKVINGHTKKIERYGKLQMDMFISGIVAFICWRIVEIIVS